MIDNECAAAAADDVVIHELLKREIGGYRCHVDRSSPGQRYALRLHLYHHLLHLNRRGILQEPADECDPKSAAEITAKHSPDAKHDEEKAEKPPDIRCNQRGPAHAAGDAPDERSKDAPAVQEEIRG